MGYVIAICGFAGSWLLVVGPVWQAFIELQEEEFDREAIEAARSTVTQPPKFSGWWWLLPPIAYVKRFRRSRAARRAFQDALPLEQLEQAVAFLNKANGWLIVALGGYLLAVSETWALVADLHWPTWVFWVLIVVIPLVAIGNAVWRTIRTRRLIKSTDLMR
jgi:hypothetical protein